MNSPVKKKKKTSGFDSSFLVRFSVKEQTLFAKRMAFLVKAGVPILDSLHMLKKQSGKGLVGRVYDRIIDDVSNGQYLSTSLSRFSHIFGNFAINIIRVGETSGILSQNLNYLAEELKKKQALKRKVIGALVYPIIITIATLGLTSLLTAYIFPKIMPIFKSLDVTLPFTTRVLIFASDFLREHGWLTLGVLVLVIVGIFVLQKTVRPFQMFNDYLLVRLPISGEIAKNYNLTNICRTLGLLLKSGTRVVEAVTITADTTTNRVYARELRIVAEGVIKGQKISKNLEMRSDLFPDMMTHLILIGETTGNLSDTLLYLAEMYENELEDSTKNLSSSIEPFLMVLMGLVVGFVAVSIITPIYEVTQNLNP